MRIQLRRTLLIATGCGIIFAGGLAHGLLTNRWARSPKLEAAAAKLKLCPLQVGDWNGRVLEIPEAQLKLAEILGYISREYSNSQTGESCNVLLVCGRPGPISVHTPDICLQGSGFHLVSPAKRTSDNDGDSLMVGDFAPPRSGIGAMRVFWGWGTGDAWSAPDNPRLQFAAEPFLYKLYVTRGLSRSGDPVEDDVCLRFLKQFQSSFHRATQAELASD